MPERSVKIIYCEASIDDVFKYFVKAYKLGKNESCDDFQATYDPRTGNVIFKMFVWHDKSVHVDVADALSDV